MTPPPAGAVQAALQRERPLYTKLNTEKKKVAYFYDSDIGNHAYNTGHPMKPHRIRLAHSLVMNYNVYKYLEVYRAKPAVVAEMTQFHTDEYIEFLRKVTPDNMDNYIREQTKYNVGDDCPVFDGLFDFCGISAGGSMEGAARLNRQKCDIAINWAGGLHHAKKSEASGFCYVNDIVLAILELLRYKKRVLYIDIDVHHGDGVEEAFYTTDRVMTVSFHKYGEYFPGTGELRDIGIGQGKNYAVNFPLRDGINDDAYEKIFEPVINAVMQYYQPEAVVLQCGSDSLSGDRLGCFNLSMRGHANCVNFVRAFGLPTLVLGGGGYTMRNVARTWAYETGRLVGVEMDSVLPFNEYYEYYGPDFELDVRPSNMDNANSPEYLEKMKIAVIENLKQTIPVPSVQMTDIPRANMGMTDEEEAELDDLDQDENKDTRTTQRQWEQNVSREDDPYESDDDSIARVNGILRYAQRTTGTRITDHENPYADRDGDEAGASGAATPSAAGASAARSPAGTRATSAAPVPAATATATGPSGEDEDADQTMEDATAPLPASVQQQPSPEESPRLDEALIKPDPVTGDKDVDMVDEVPEIAKEEAGFASASGATGGVSTVETVGAGEADDPVQAATTSEKDVAVPATEQASESKPADEAS